MSLPDVVGVAEASGTGDDSGHGGPVLSILLELIVILLAAKLGGDLFERFNQPAVLGELVIGMIIGNLTLVGFDGFELFKSSFKSGSIQSAPQSSGLSNPISHEASSLQSDEFP